MFLGKVYRLSLNLKVCQEKRHFEIQSFSVGARGWTSLHVHQDDSVMFMVTFMAPMLIIHYQGVPFFHIEREDSEGAGDSTE
jgi:hypothetical protein